MRLFISGSAPLLTDTFEAWQERTGHTILERRGGTVGLALPGVDLRVVDERGQSMPGGQISGIEVRGPNVFKGYWQMPEKTQEAFTPDGWFKTGDVGLQDEQG